MYKALNLPRKQDIPLQIEVDEKTRAIICRIVAEEQPKADAKGASFH